MRKFIIEFSFTLCKSGRSYCGVDGWYVENRSRRFSLPPDRDLEEKAQKVWKLIGEKYEKYQAPEPLRSPKFLTLKELQTSETKVDWQP